MLFHDATPRTRCPTLQGQQRSRPKPGREAVCYHKSDDKMQGVCGTRGEDGKQEVDQDFRHVQVGIRDVVLTIKPRFACLYPLPTPCLT